MPFDVERVLFGVGAITAGVGLFFIRRWFARRSMAFQNRVFGFRFGAREVLMTEVIAAIVAGGWIATGVAVLLGARIAD